MGIEGICLKNTHFYTQSPVQSNFNFQQTSHHLLLILYKRVPIRIILILSHHIPNNRYIRLICRITLRLFSPLQHIIDDLCDHRCKLQLRPWDRTTIHSPPHSYNVLFSLCTMGSIAIFIATFSFPSSSNPLPPLLPLVSIRLFLCRIESGCPNTWIISASSFSSVTPSDCATKFISLITCVCSR